MTRTPFLRSGSPRILVITIRATGQKTLVRLPNATLRTLTVALVEFALPRGLMVSDLAFAVRPPYRRRLVAPVNAGLAGGMNVHA